MADEIRKGLKEVASLIVATNKKLDEANDTALADTSTEISKSVTENTTAINDLSTNLAESTKNTRSVTENITTSAFRAFSSDQDSVRKLQKEEIDERKRANEELKQKIEEQGGLAKDNSKYVKESYEIQKEEFKLRKRNPNLSRAAQSEIDDEAKKAAKENRKTGGLMQKMAGSVLNSAKNVGKTALMGLFGIASVLGLGAFLIGLSLFMNSPYWGKTVKWFSEVGIPKLEKIYDYLTNIGEGFGGMETTLLALSAMFAVGGVFRLLFGKKGKIGVIIAAITAAAAWFGLEIPVDSTPTSDGDGAPSAGSGAGLGKGDAVLGAGMVATAVVGQAMRSGPPGGTSDQKGAKKSNWMKRFGKILPGPVIGLLEAAGIDWSLPAKDLVKPLSRILAGATGAAVGAVAGGGLLSAVMSIGGYYLGEEYGGPAMEPVAEWMLGFRNDATIDKDRWRAPGGDGNDITYNEYVNRNNPEQHLLKMMDDMEAENIKAGMDGALTKDQRAQVESAHRAMEHTQGVAILRKENRNKFNLANLNEKQMLLGAAVGIESGVRANIPKTSAVESANIRAATDSRAVTAKMLVDAHNLLIDAKKGMSITNISQNLNSIAADNSINQGGSQYPLAYTIYGNLNTGHPYMQR